MSSLWFKAEIQEQQEKSVGRQENGVHQEHYGKGRKTQPALDTL